MKCSYQYKVTVQGVIDQETGISAVTNLLHSNFSHVKFENKPGDVLEVYAEDTFKGSEIGRILEILFEQSAFKVQIFKYRVRSRTIQEPHPAAVSKAIISMTSKHLE
jgi:hypothetical protein